MRLKRRNPRMLEIIENKKGATPSVAPLYQNGLSDVTGYSP
ncbi:hypothetical protein [Shivajiella indica]|uniref:Uncharacterized protein n=1 Tax=Shivajiella indica TaxID=872115 RepID=A0ABW5B797_9BACT